MLYAALKTVHIVSILVWVGGMVFAHFFLRPALADLEPATRLRLMHGVLSRFFAVVTWVSLLAFFSGTWMMGRFAKEAAQSGASVSMPIDWSIMAAIGLLMVLIFGHIRFALFRRFNRQVQQADWPAAAQALGDIRRWVAINMTLGLGIVVMTLLY